MVRPPKGGADGEAVHAHDLAREGRKRGRVRQALERVGRLEPPRRTRSSRAASPRPGKPAGVHQLRPMGEYGGRQELARPRWLPGTGGTAQRGTRQLRATNARDRRPALDIDVLSTARDRVRETAQRAPRLKSFVLHLLRAGGGGSPSAQMMAASVARLG